MMINEAHPAAPSLASQLTKEGSESPTWHGFSNTTKALIPHVKLLPSHWLIPDVNLKERMNLQTCRERTLKCKHHRERQHTAGNVARSGSSSRVYFNIWTAGEQEIRKAESWGDWRHPGKHLPWARCLESLDQQNASVPWACPNLSTRRDIQQNMQKSETMTVFYQA